MVRQVMDGCVLTWGPCRSTGVQLQWRLASFCLGCVPGLAILAQCLCRIENHSMSPVCFVTKQVSEPRKKERVFCYVSCFTETGDDRHDKREKMHTPLFAISSVCDSRMCRWMVRRKNEALSSYLFIIYSLFRQHVHCCSTKKASQSGIHAW